MNLKKQVEAILFSAGRKIEVEEIAKLVDSNEASVKKLLRELKKDYDKQEAPTMILEEGTAWKMTVREEYLGTVRKITPYMEFSKTLMETLAVVAWKQPILQSDVIKVRTNKAYEHIAELEKMGFLAKERHGRSFLLKLSQKFYDYFSLRDDLDVRKLFKHIKDDEPQKKVNEFEPIEEMSEPTEEAEESKHMAETNNPEVPLVENLNKPPAHNLGEETDTEEESDDLGQDDLTQEDPQSEDVEAIQDKPPK